MERKSRRDRAAFEAYVVEHHVRLRAFIRSLAVDPDWVDDVAQEAFLVAYREWGSYDPSQDFGKWVRGIAANIVRNELRKDARRQRILHTDLARLLLGRQTASPQPAEEPVTLDAVRECLGKLTARFRGLVQARYRDGDTAPELARRFGLTPDNVRQILVRSREQIRQCVELRLSKEAGHE